MSAASQDMNQVDANFGVKLACSYCRSEVPNIVEDFASGDYVCGDCGLVLGDRIIDTRSEWRTFADAEGDDPSRVGAAANPLLDGDQLDTIISRGGDNGSGLARDLIRAQDRSSARAGDETLLKAYRDISSMCDAYDISKGIATMAKKLYKEAADKKLNRGKSGDALIAVCIMIACRENGAPRTFKEICALTKVDRKEFGRAFKAVKEKLSVDTNVTSSQDLIGRFCSNLHLGQDVQRISRMLTENAKDMDHILGKSPLTIASACIYMASHLVGNPRDPRAISAISGVSDATIRSTYRILYTGRAQLLTPELMARCPNANIANLALIRTVL
ncbi:transcription initiation factor IIB [Coemansia javaensis]|uniref:Transcription initiation factor IIB n=1 Tax=Coemansia javaensis TaxID=2761396 RepID=A0A9W8HB34_9FUNG|nr:transcription initiation factor IIB [Coemansia javaensis]